MWQGDWIAGKGVGLVCLDTTSGPVRVFNTHTCANYGRVYRHVDIHGRPYVLCLVFTSSVVIDSSRPCSGVTALQLRATPAF